ncbi:MAG: nuclear transport factor 2 family protein [Hyphomonadaceae bacterium]|nr:nuclear transport factor 2 family protein [Hyphomonadaceae bacterium]
MRLAVLGAALLSLGAAPSLAHAQRYDPAPDDPRIVAVLEQRERQFAAFKTGDVAALEAIFAPDVLVNAPVDRVVDRVEVLGRVHARQSRFEGEDVTHLEVAAVRGDLVVLMGEEVVQPTGANPHAGRIVRRRFTDVWRMSDGAWRLIARQATNVSVK